MSRRIVSALLLLGAGCATTQGAQQGAPKEERRQLVNRSEFDVAVCNPAPEAQAVAASNELSITGALLTARPLILECLVDPKHRGPEKVTEVNVTTTVSEEGPKHEVAGTNLTPEGTACVEKALESIPTLPPLEKGAQPAAGKLAVQHNVDTSRAVVFGINEGSDIAGAIRVAQPTWCDCYAQFKDATPPSVRARFDVEQGATNPSNIRFEPVGEAPAEAQALEQCVQGKLQALAVNAPANKLTNVPYTFDFINSHAKAPAANSEPPVKIEQMDARRAVEQGQTAITIGNRLAAATAFDSLVATYKKNPRKVTIKQLEDSCKEVLKADDAWIAQLEEQVGVEQETMTMVQGFAATDPRWAEVQAPTEQAVAQTQQDIAQAKQQRQTDEGACPKMKL